MVEELLLHEFDELELQQGPAEGVQPRRAAQSGLTGGRTAEATPVATRQNGQRAGTTALAAQDDAAEQGLDVEDEGSAAEQAQPPSSPCSPRASAAGSEAGDMTCAICLHTIQLEELALVKGCDHMYCAKCILHWALHKETPWCPQCKQPFSYLFTYRALDGTLQDFPSEESVTLLKRARWFEDHVRASERGKALVDDSREAEEHAWQEYAEEFDLAEDEEIEAYYFSSAAGRARVVLENRRFGAGGYLSSGRRQARPIPGGPRRGGGKPAKSGEHAVVGTPPVAMPSFNTPNAQGGRKARPASGAVGSSAGPSSAPRPVSAPAVAEAFGTSPSGSGIIYGSSPSGSGRRARRNAKRQAMDSALQQMGFEA